MVIGIRNNGICGILGQCVVAASFLAVALQVMDPALAALGAVGLLFINSIVSSTNKQQETVVLTLPDGSGDDEYVDRVLASSLSEESFKIIRTDNTNQAVWQPKTKEEMAKVINKIDAQPKGRACYQHALQLVNTTSPIFFTETSASSLAHRKEIIKFLQADRFISIPILEWEKGTNFYEIAMKTVAKGWLGIELTSDQCKTFQELNEDFKKGIESTVEQGKYQKFIEELLQEQIEKIKTQGSSASTDGLLVQEIANKLQKNSNQNNLHKDPDLKSLLLVLLAVDNLEIVTKHMLQKVMRSKNKELKRLEDEIDQSGVIGSDGSLKMSILKDSTQMPHLDQLYKDALLSTMSEDIVVTRYVENEMECGDHTVPPNTYLSIKSPAVGPEVFSAGKRSCPGRLVAEAIAKTLAIKMIQECKIQREHLY